MALRHVTLEEWEEVTVGPDSELTAVELGELLEAWRRVQPTSAEGLFRFTESGVAPRNWIGVLRSPSIQLEVVPRGLRSLSQDQRNRLDVNVQQMLSSVLLGSVQSGREESSGAGGRLDSAVTALVEQTRTVLRTHRPRLYRARTAAMSAPRGRVNPVPTDLLSLRRPGLVVSTWVELSDDAPELQVIKSVLASTRQRVSVRTWRHVEGLLVDLQGVSIIDPWRCRTVRARRKMNAWDAPLALAIDILDGRVGGLLAGDAQGDAELVNIARLFERYVAIAMRAEMIGTERLDAQVSKSPGVWESGPKVGRSPADFVVDLVYSQAGTAKVLLDTKWKQLRLDADGFGIASADLQQMISYAHVAGCRDVALVYPWIGPRDPFSSPPRLRVFDGHTTVSVYCLPMVVDDVREAVRTLVAQLRSVVD